MVKTAFLALSMAALAGGSSQAATVVAQFDIGQANGDGWGLITTGSLSATNGGITLAVNGSGLQSRTRGGIPSDVAQDFLFNNSTISFLFTGLEPNQPYEFLTYAHDNTGGGAEAANWFAGPAIPANLQHSWINSASTVDPFTLTGFSDGSGSLTINLVATNSNNRANGFEVVAVPEPSIALLCGFALLGLLRRRRR